MLWHYGVTISKLICKYFKQPWFEWKSQLGMNFNMKYENYDQCKYSGR